MYVRLGSLADICSAKGHVSALLSIATSIASFVVPAKGQKWTYFQISSENRLSVLLCLLTQILFHSNHPSSRLAS